MCWIKCEWKTHIFIYIYVHIHSYTYKYFNDLINIHILYFFPFLIYIYIYIYIYIFIYILKKIHLAASPVWLRYVTNLSNKYQQEHQQCIYLQIPNYLILLDISIENKRKSSSGLFFLTLCKSVNLFICLYVNLYIYIYIYTKITNL